jgi:hypothetical protein
LVMRPVSARSVLWRWRYSARSGATGADAGVVDGGGLSGGAGDEVGPAVAEEQSMAVTCHIGCLAPLLFLPLIFILPLGGSCPAPVSPPIGVGVCEIETTQLPPDAMRAGRSRAPASVAAARSRVPSQCRGKVWGVASALA